MGLVCGVEVGDGRFEGEETGTRVSGILCCSSQGLSLCLFVDEYSITTYYVKVAFFLYHQVVRVQMKGGLSLYLR